MTATESGHPPAGRRCLVAGAYGFIGSAVARAFASAGWRVVGAGRDTALARRLVAGIEWVACDFNASAEADAWRRRLEGFDTVVNCIGILQTGGGDDARRIHVDGPAALFEGAARAGVRRLIHVSAMSAEDEIDTEYARTKLACEQHVSQLALDWLILKPSLVIGAGSYGGTSMIRGLAGVPLVTPLPGGGTQTFQPIAMSDLASGIVRLAAEGAPSRTTLYAPGPEVLTLRDIVARTRAWLGFKPAPALAIGHAVTHALLKLGDLWVRLGNRTSLCTTSFRHMAYDKVQSPEPFAEATGLALKSFAAGLAETPATLQDRLHARIAWPGFGLRFVLALQLVVAGAAGSWPTGTADAMRSLDAGSPMSASVAAALIAVHLVQSLSGLMLLFDRWVRAAGLAAIASLVLAFGFTLASSLTSPAAWSVAGLETAFHVLAVAVVMALAEER